MRSWFLEHRYATRQTVSRLVRQPLSTLLNILVVGIALALPLAGYTLLTSLQPLTGRLVSDPEITVFMSLETTRADAEALAPRLRALPSVERVEFIPRERALDRLRQQPGMQEVLGALEVNPLPDAWILRLRPAPLSMGGARGGDAERLGAQLRGLPGVAEVQLDSTWIRRMEAFLHFLRLGLALLAGALAIAVIAVIFNTIRLQVLTQREEIIVSSLIGATPAFVRRPFHYMGALQGAAGGALALGLVTLFLQPLNGAVAEFARLYATPFRFSLPPPEQLLAFVALAGFLGWLGAMFSVRRHLAKLRD